jgi:hypothetical protein
MWDFNLAWYIEIEEQFGEKLRIKKMSKICSWLMWKNALNWIEPHECKKYKKVVSCYKYFQSHLKSPHVVKSYK